MDLLDTCLKIVIYSYSSGIERYHLNGEASSPGITNTHEKGHLDAMVIIKKQNYCKDVIFINVKGNDIDEMSTILCGQLKEHLN